MSKNLSQRLKDTRIDASGLRAQLKEERRQAIKHIERLEKYVAAHPDKSGAVMGPLPPPLGSVCLFLPTGHTFTFRRVRICCDNETVLVMKYEAMSDGCPKTLTVLKSNIVAWSVMP
jgi:hypothetical protein